MQSLSYNPRTQYEKFGEKIYNLLVENFSQVYYVGGIVRDLLLQRRVADIDLATSVSPKTVAEILKVNGLRPCLEHIKFGVITVPYRTQTIEIATFRRDLVSSFRYPKVTWVRTPEQDSKRRDFTINSLYFSQKYKKILDFHGGIKDVHEKILRFIGPPEQRLLEDPLRIIRAWRFQIELNFKLNKSASLAIEKNRSLVNKISRTRVEREIEKCSSQKNKNNLRQKISNAAYLT